MIKDVEEFGAELEFEAFAELEIFGGGEVDVPETRAEDLIASEVAKVAVGISGGDGWIGEGIGI